MKSKQCNLEKMIKYWQLKLHLGDWRIRSFWEPALESQGRVYWEAKLWDATILIKPPDSNPDRDPIEKTVIHELLHLHFAVLGDSAPPNVESSIDTMAWLIYNAKNNVPKTSSH